MRSKRLTAGGLSVTEDCPEVGGIGPEPSSVVLVHGAMDRNASFSRASRHLKDLRIKRYDRRGYGRSLELGTGDLADHAHDLLEVLDGRPSTIVGHSIGGLVALLVAARRPELALSVVVYEPPLPWEPWWHDGTPETPIDGDPGDAAELFLKSMLGERTWRRFPAAMRAERRAEGPALRRDLTMALRRPDGFSLEDVTVPVVVGLGSLTNARHRRAAQTVADQVADGELVELVDADHGAHFGRPGPFAELIQRGVARANRPS